MSIPNDQALSLAWDVEAYRLFLRHLFQDLEPPIQWHPRIKVLEKGFLFLRNWEDFFLLNNDNDSLYRCLLENSELNLLFSPWHHPFKFIATIALTFTICISRLPLMYISYKKRSQGLYGMKQNRTPHQDYPESFVFVLY